MKANRRTPACILRHGAFAGAVALSALLGACVGPVPSPAPAPAAPPRPSPQQRVPTAPTDWHDLPATPGIWQWRREGGLSTARFGDSPQPALFSLTCNPIAGTIILSRSGPFATTEMSILTTTVSRRLPVHIDPGGTVAATLAARDPLLDAMAFSRGRFAVEIAGATRLLLPSWPEVSRVIEDCR